jgi:hypothetical protein
MLQIRLLRCFGQRHRPEPHRLFLSGVSELILAPEELGATDDTDADALLKLYNHMPTDLQPHGKSSPRLSSW